MIIAEIEKQEQEGDLLAYEMSVDQEDIGFLFQLISKNYSNKEGSIVREYTSNAIDSHIEAGIIDKLVDVKFNYDLENGYTFHVIDYGMGISVDRMNDVFKKALKSTKRNTNEQLGGYGIGKLAALGYTDLFYITTVYNNVCYEYIMHTMNVKPTIELLNSYECIKHNQTEILINVRKESVVKFKSEITSQLMFFTGVNISSNFYNVSANHIIEFETFKICNNFSGKTGCLLGEVYYPLNIEMLNQNLVNHLPQFKQRGYRDLSAILESFPIVLQFNIGDFNVTITREEINYTPNTIKVIEEKILLALTEFYDYYKKRYSSKLVTSSYKEYMSKKLLNKIDLIDSNNNKIENFEDYFFYIENIFTETEREVKFKLFEDNNIYLEEKKQLERVINTFVHIESSQIVRKHYKTSTLGECFNMYNLFLNDYKILTKVEKIYITEKYGNFHYVNVSKNFKSFCIKMKALTSLKKGYVKIAIELYDLMLKEFNLLKISENLPDEQYVLDYKEELKNNRQQYQNDKTEIIYRNKYNSIHKTTVEFLNKNYQQIIYSFDETVFQLDKILATVLYRTQRTRKRPVLETPNKVYYKQDFRQKFLFVKLNKTNINKLKYFDKLVHINDFLFLNPKLMYKSKLSTIISIYNDNTVKEKSNILKKEINDFNKKLVNAIYYDLNTLINKLNITYDLKKEEQYFYDELQKEKQKIVNKIKSYDVFNYFTSYATHNFICKNVKHLRYLDKKYRNTTQNDLFEFNEKCKTIEFFDGCTEKVITSNLILI